MFAAALTASTDSSLSRATSDLLGVVECEAIGHPGEIVDDGVGLVAPRHEVLEDPANHVASPLVLAPRLRAEVDPLEHEAPEREHRVPERLALDDVAGRRGGLDQVVHER